MPGSPPASKAAQTNGVFNPGHYILDYSTGGDKTTFDVCNANAAVKGVLIKLRWDAFHIGYGQFDYSHIEQALSWLGTGKQLMIYFEYNSFGTSRGHIPEFVRQDATYGGGWDCPPSDVFANGRSVGYGLYSVGNVGNKGQLPCLWEAKVQALMQEAIDGLAARLADEDRFELLMLGETAASNYGDNSPIGNSEKTGNRDWFQLVQGPMAAAFPRHSVGHQINWSGWHGINRDALIDNGVALNNANPAQSQAFGQVDGGVQYVVPELGGSMAAICESMRLTGDNHVNWAKWEYFNTPTTNLGYGYTIAEACEAYQDAIDPWYHVHAYQTLYKDTGPQEKAEVIDYINSTGGTRRSLEFYGGYIPPEPEEPGPVPGDITGKSSTEDTGWNNFVDIPRPADLLQGELMVAVVNLAAPADSSAPYWDTPAGWNAVIVPHDSGKHYTGVFTKVATDNEPATTRFQSSGAVRYVSGMMRNYSGVHADIMDVSVELISNTDNQGAPVASPITTQYDNSMSVIALSIFNDTANSVTVPAGYAFGGEAVYAASAVMMAEKTVTPAGTETPGAWAVTGGGSQTYTMITMALRSAQTAPVVLPIAWDEPIPDQETHPGYQGYTFHTAPYITANTGDGTAITYSLTSTPTGFAIDSATGIITIEGADSGNYPLEVTATDDSDAASTTFTITLTVDAVPGMQISAEGSITAVTDKFSVSIGAGIAYGTFWCSISSTVPYDLDSAERIVDAGHADNDDTKMVTGDTQTPIFLFEGLTPGAVYYFGAVQEAND